jgi:hypothetical protein
VTDHLSRRATAGWIVAALLLATPFAAVAVELAPGDASALGSPTAVAFALAPGAPTQLTARADGARPATPLGAVMPQSTELSSGPGWAGIDYRAACSGCLQPDPSLGDGGGYVLEMTNGTERVWLTNGSRVTNQSLDRLFGAGSDELADPQVVFDSQSLRWFIAAEDLTSSSILYAVSGSSDPLGGWDVQSFVPPAGSVPQDPLMVVDADTVVVTANEFSSSGAFQGAQVWAANKTDLVDGRRVAQAAVDAPDPTVSNLVPATPLSDASTVYLLADVPGSGGSLRLSALTGAPPGATTLTAIANFTTSVLTPPNATQPNTTNLLDVGGAALQSASWRAGTLWAAATGACTPTGDTGVRSCLHLWEIDTASGLLEQDFLWSTGAGTYDFYPAVSITADGDLTVAFGESSATLFPSILASAQEVTDPTGSLEVPLTLHNGTGPDSPATGCVVGVCPFGSDFAIAFNPSTDVRMWVVGEYANVNYTTNDWRTWVDQVSDYPMAPVTFDESQLPAGTPWSVTVNGEAASSTNGSLTLGERNGSYTFSVVTPIAGPPGVRYLANPSSGTFTVNGTALNLSVSFVVQDQLTTLAQPSGDGTVFPGGGWFDAESNVSLSALAAPGYKFFAWAGSGTGAYSGTADPATLLLTTPVTEQAQFWASSTFPVSVTEAGLPAGTNWTATVNGVSNGSDGATILFSEPNGAYSYSVSSPVQGGPGVQYVAKPASGLFDISGSRAEVAVVYSPEFQLVAAPAALGAGVVSPSGGWYTAGTPVNLSALAAPGELFESWVGTGAGSYTGTENPAPVTMDAPVSEQVVFASGTTYSVTYAESGLPAGATWSVSTNGVSSTTNSTSLTFNEPNGSYSFGAESTYSEANGTSFRAIPSFSTFTVSGAPVQFVVDFFPVSATSSQPTIGGGPVGSSGVPAWALEAALAGLVLFAVLLTLIWRRKAEPPTAPVLPPPPPPWDESH